MSKSEQATTGPVWVLMTEYGHISVGQRDDPEIIRITELDNNTTMTTHGMDTKDDDNTLTLFPVEYKPSIWQKVLTWISTWYSKAGEPTDDILPGKTLSMLQIRTNPQQPSQILEGGCVFPASMVTAFSAYPSSGETSDEQPMVRTLMADVHFLKEQTTPDNMFQSLVSMKMTPCAKDASLSEPDKINDGITNGTSTSQWKFDTFGSTVLYDLKKTRQHMKGFLAVSARSKEDPHLQKFTYLRKLDENE